MTDNNSNNADEIYESVTMNFSPADLCYSHYREYMKKDPYDENEIACAMAVYQKVNNGKDNYSFHFYGDVKNVLWALTDYLLDLLISNAKKKDICSLQNIIMTYSRYLIETAEHEFLTDIPFSHSNVKAESDSQLYSHFRKEFANFIQYMNNPTDSGFDNAGFMIVSKLEDDYRDDHSTCYGDMYSAIKTVTILLLAIMESIIADAKSLCTDKNKKRKAKEKMLTRYLEFFELTALTELFSSD